MAEELSPDPPGAAPTESGSSATAARRYLGGIPADWRVRYGVPMTEGVPIDSEFGVISDTATGSFDRKPQYFVGDEFEPGRWPPEHIAGLQLDLVRAGLLKAGSYSPGSWDSASRNAYEELLTEANFGAEEWETALDRRISIGDEIGGYGSSSGGGGGAGRTVRLSNPDDLKRVFDETAQDTIGRKLDPYNQGSGDQLVAEYQGIEAGAQSGGGTVTDPEDPTTFAQRRAKEMAPVEAQARSLAGVYGSFVKMLGG